MEKNTIAEAILKRLEDKKEIPFHAWVLEHIYLDGAKFSFEGHKYLENTYVDAHYNEVFMKAAQVGISTRMALKTFWLGDMMPSTALYYFPTDGDVEDFSNERIKKFAYGGIGRGTSGCGGSGLTFLSRITGGGFCLKNL